MTANKKFEGDDLRQRDPKFLPPRFSQYLATVDCLSAYAQEKHGRSILAFTIRWILDRGDKVAALWGARSANQPNAAEEAMGWKLSAADYEELTRSLPRP